MNIKNLGKKTVLLTCLVTGLLIVNTTITLAANPKIEVEKPKEVNIIELGPLIKAAISISLVVAALLTFAFLIWGGIQWLTSGGDKAQYEAARNRITAALVGLAIVACSWLLIKIIAYFFGLPDPFGGKFEIPKGY